MAWKLIGLTFCFLFAVAMGVLCLFFTDAAIRLTVRPLERSRDRLSRLVLPYYRSRFYRVQTKVVGAVALLMSLAVAAGIIYMLATGG